MNVFLCILGHYEVVKYLLENKADVNKQTHCGATAMHFAVQSNNLGIVEMLINSNAQQLKNKHCTLITFYYCFFFIKIMYVNTLNHFFLKL